MNQISTIVIVGIFVLIGAVIYFCNREADCARAGGFLAQGILEMRCVSLKATIPE
jgi:hypothetical protein